MIFSQDCLFSKEHIWLKEQYNICRIGITDVFQSILGKVNHLKLPTIGQAFLQNDIAGEIITDNHEHEIYLPITGVITDVNNKIIDNPGLINDAPFEEGWLIKIEIVDKGQLAILMNAKEYEIYVCKQIKIDRKYLYR